VVINLESDMKKVQPIILSILAIALFCQWADAGAVKKGVAGTEKGVKEGVGGTKKGAKVAVGGTKKGVKEAVGGTKKGLKETGKAFKKVF
jgi:hypothetical protein